MIYTQISNPTTTSIWTATATTNASPTKFSLSDGTNSVDYLGSFIYSNGSLTSGTVTGIVGYTGSAPDYSVTGGNWNVVTFGSYLNSGDSAALLEFMAAGNDTWNGSNFADLMEHIGTGDDVVNGNGGNDIIRTSAGNDTIDGGSGFDTTAFSSNRANYTISKAGSTVSVKATTGTDGTDTLTNIEYLQFTDQPVVIAPANTSNQYAALLYQGALGRTPDPTGLAYWRDLAENLSPSTKAMGLYGLSDATGNFNGNLSIAGGFTQSTEFISKYGSLTNNQFVTQLYANVLDRTPDPSGLSDWVGQLSRGTTREHVLIGFAESAEAVANATVGFVGIHGHHDAWLILS